MSSDAADETLNALIEAWTPGRYGAEAVADVLLGAYNPDRKTPGQYCAECRADSRFITVMNGAAVITRARASDFGIMPMDLISRGIASDTDFPIPSLYMKVWRLSKKKSIRSSHGRLM